MSVEYEKAWLIMSCGLSTTIEINRSSLSTQSTSYPLLRDEALALPPPLFAIAQHDLPI